MVWMGVRVVAGERSCNNVRIKQTLWYDTGTNRVRYLAGFFFSGMGSFARIYHHLLCFVPSNANAILC